VDNHGIPLDLHDSYYPDQKRGIYIGMVFDTPFETNCIVTAGIDSEGKFLALDSDGVECEYVAEMVTKVHESDDAYIQEMGRKYWY